jgi:hypothetical protein
MLTINVEFETMEELIDYCFPRSKNSIRQKTEVAKEQTESKVDAPVVRSQATLFDSTLLD